MSKHPNHEADMENANKGTPGQNKTHAKNQGNKGWQQNPQNPANQKNNSENNKSEKWLEFIKKLKPSSFWLKARFFIFYIALRLKDIRND